MTVRTANQNPLNSTSVRRALFGTGGWVSTLSKIPVVLLVLASGNTLAQEEDLPEFKVDLQDDGREVTYLAGENYDILSGEMHHYMTDLVLEGNGPPITVSRTTEGTGGIGRRVLERFNLDIPTLSFNNNNRAGFTGNCIDSKLVSNTTPDLKEHWDGRNTPVTFQMGSSSIQFYSTAASELPGNIARFSGQDADYVSASNWYIECVPTTGASPFDYSDEYHVKSPDGMTYIMGKGMAERVNGYRWDGERSVLSNVAWRLTDVIDPYGNTLEYIYSNNDFYGTSNRQPRIQNSVKLGRVDKLDRIISSDGREVVFNYEWIDYGTFYRDRNHWRLTSVESNGVPNKHLVEYQLDVVGRAYKFTVTYDKTSSIVYQYNDANALSTLKSITYPNGGLVTYDQYTLESINGHSLYPSSSVRTSKLAQRTVHHTDGSTAIYRYESEHIDSDKIRRTIHTPEKTIDYTYRKSNTQLKKLRPSEKVEADHGRLLSMRDYGRVLNSGEARVNPIYEKNFTYRAVSSVTTAFAANVAGSLQMPGTTNIVPDVVTTTLSSLEHPNRKQTFTRTFEAYDSPGYGLPTLIKETSAADQVRFIKHAYEHNFNDWIRGKPKSVTVSKTKNGPAVDRTSFEYNTFGDVKTVNRNGIVTRTTYHEYGPYRGQIKTHADALNNIYTYSKYYRGIATQEIDERGRVKISRVNSDGTVEFVSRLGSSQIGYTYAYDQARRLKSILSPRTETSQISIEWDGLTKKTETQGNTGDWMRETFFDEFGRVIFVGTYTAKNGGSWSSVLYEYDALGRKTFESYPANLHSVHRNARSVFKGTTYEYDSSGRVARIVRDADDANIVTTYNYASNSNQKLRIAMTDGRSKTTVEEFDAFGEPSYDYISRHVSAIGVVTTYNRDVSYRLNSFTRGGVARSYNYYPNKLLQSIWNPENGSTSYTYYANGWLENQTNHAETTHYTYHPDGQHYVVAMSGNGDAVVRTFDYDSNGNLYTANNQSGASSNTWTYGYDDEDNLLSETLSIDGAQYALTYQYDNLSNLDKVTYPNGRQYGFEPDGLGRAGSIQEVGGKVVYDSISYHPNGMTHVLSRGSHRIQNTIDTAQRGRQRQIILNSTQEKHADRLYSYDAASNVRLINDFVDNRNTTLVFDAVNRLKRANINDSDNWKFNYSNQDDLTKVTHGSSVDTYVYDNDTRLLRQIKSNNSSIPTREFSYDSMGSMKTSDALWSGNELRRRTLTRNSAGQISRLDDGAVTDYEYDAQGLRVKKSGNGIVYSVYGAGGVLLYREDTNTGVTSEYLYAAGELVARRDDARNDDPPTSKPVKPTLVAPIGTITTSNPLYTWEAISGATDYFIDVRDLGSSSAIIFKRYTAAQVGCESGTGTCSVQKADVPMSGDKRWRVRARNSIGNGKWSAFKTFTVETGPTSKPVKPTLVAPIGTITTTNPLYTWEAISGATDYFIDVRDLGSSSAIIFKRYTAAQVGCESGTGTCSVQKADVPMSGDKRWRVRARNSIGNGKWSAFKTFTVETGPTSKPVKPTLVAPIGTITTTNPLYSWEAISGATDYFIDVRDLGSSSAIIFKRYTAAQVGCESGTGTCSVQKADVPMSGDKRWRVRARNSIGNGKWSAFKTFTVDSTPPITKPSVPTPLTPEGSGTRSNPTYTWDAVLGAQNYRIDVREASNTTVLIYQTYSAADANCAGGTGTCSVQKADVPMSGDKRWRVMAENSAGNSGWSNYKHFSVGATQPDTPPETPSPAWPSGNINTANPTYQWEAVSGATSYFIEVQDSSNAVRIWKEYSATELGCVNAGDRCSISKPDAPMTGTNRWRALSANSIGQSAWSGWKSFSVSN